VCEEPAAATDAFLGYTIEPGALVDGPDTGAGAMSLENDGHTEAGPGVYWVIGIGGVTTSLRPNDAELEPVGKDAEGCAGRVHVPSKGDWRWAGWMTDCGGGIEAC
jgi:hypothetical protein